ncbi:hypothetical protein G9F31_15230 [Acinetobacter sp. 187]|nr:hypothetical protein [Acinetobacter lanii]
MKVDADGKPIVFSGENANGKNAANSLGVRPSEAGMSGATSIDSLPSHRKPVQDGGTMKGAKTFSIDTDELNKNGLKAVNDHKDHISIERKDANMNQSEFEKALADTKDKWVPCGK